MFKSFFRLVSLTWYPFPGTLCSLQKPTSFLLCFVSGETEDQRREMLSYEEPL
jgi:hypothetical protein